MISTLVTTSRDACPSNRNNNVNISIKKKINIYRFVVMMVLKCWIWRGLKVPSFNSSSYCLAALIVLSNSFIFILWSKPGVGWYNDWGDWLKILGSWVQALAVSLNNTRWVDSACHPSEVGKMSTSFLETGHCINNTAVLPQWCNQQPQAVNEIIRIPWSNLSSSDPQPHRAQLLLINKSKLYSPLWL